MKSVPEFLKNSPFESLQCVLSSEILTLNKQVSQPYPGEKGQLTEIYY